MKKALFLTAYNRPNYFSQVLDSWSKVRGLDSWDIYISLEPSTSWREQELAAYEAFSWHDNVEVVVNKEILGVLHHPWVGFQHLFIDRGYDFVVRAEDDLVVSADILEFFEFASSEFKDNESVAAVVAYTDEEGEADTVRLSQGFGPWVWGTWFDRWEGLIGPTWDHDYSTNSGIPGHKSGWDWNLNERIFPQHQLLSVVPTRSRVHNIGVVGTHAVAADYHSSPSFADDHGSQEFRVISSEVDS